MRKKYQRISCGKRYCSLCYFSYPHFKVCILHFWSSTFILKWLFENTLPIYLYLYERVYVYLCIPKQNKWGRLKWSPTATMLTVCSSTWTALSYLVIRILQMITFMTPNAWKPALLNNLNSTQKCVLLCIANCGNGISWQCAKNYYLFK